MAFPFSTLVKRFGNPTVDGVFQIARVIYEERSDWT